MLSTLLKHALLVAALCATCAAAAASAPAANTAPPSPERRLVAGRRRALVGQSPSDMFNDLLKGAAPALEKAIGHMKFDDYDKDGVKLTNLRTFDFDCSDGCLSGSIQGMRVSVQVHKFSLRLHSRYKAKKGWVTLQGQCDFQIQDMDGKGSAAISSLSPFKLSGVNVNVNVGKLVPSCGGLSGAIINVAVHLFQDKIVKAIKSGAENAIRNVLEGHGDNAFSAENARENGRLALLKAWSVDQAQCTGDMQRCHTDEECCNGGSCLWMGGCGSNGGNCCDNMMRTESSLRKVLSEIGLE
jgi:hypothetical protein